MPVGVGDDHGLDTDGTDRPALPGFAPNSTAVWGAFPLNPPYHRYTEGGCKWVFAVLQPGVKYYNSSDPANKNIINPQEVGLAGIYEIYPITQWAWGANIGIPDALQLRWDGAKQTLILHKFGVVAANNAELNTDESPQGANFHVLIRGY